MASREGGSYNVSICYWEASRNQWEPRVQNYWWRSELDNLLSSHGALGSAGDKPNQTQTQTGLQTRSNVRSPNRHCTCLSHYSGNGCCLSRETIFKTIAQDGTQHPVFKAYRQEDRVSRHHVLWSPFILGVYLFSIIPKTGESEGLTNWHSKRITLSPRLCWENTSQIWVLPLQETRWNSLVNIVQSRTYSGPTAGAPLRWHCCNSTWRLLSSALLPRPQQEPKPHAELVNVTMSQNNGKPVNSSGLSNTFLCGSCVCWKVCI